MLWIQIVTSPAVLIHATICDSIVLSEPGFDPRAFDSLCDRRRRFEVVGVHLVDTLLFDTNSAIGDKKRIETQLAKGHRRCRIRISLRCPSSYIIN